MAASPITFLNQISQASQRRPAIALLVFLGVGMLFRDVAPGLGWIGLMIAMGLTIVAIGARQVAYLSNTCLAITIMLVGLCAAQIIQFQYPANHISAFTTSSARLAQIELHLPETPRLLLPPPDQLRPLPPKQVALADVRAVRTNDGWDPASGQVSLSIEQLNPGLQAGQIVRIIGLVERPMPPTGPGQFDWASYYRAQRILASIRVTHADAVIIVQNRGASPLAWLREKTRHLLAMGFPSSRAIDHALLAAMVLGDSDPQLRDIQDEFVHTGTVHHLSISGLHIAIVGGFVLLLCRLLRCPPRKAIALATAVVILYALVALPSWPGIRSTIMCTAAAIGLLTRRPVDALQLFAAAVAMILFVHPADLSDGGFQVSFAAVLGLILFSRHAMRWVWSLGSNPDTAALGMQRRSALSRAGRWVSYFVLNTFVAGCIAWLMSMPLVAYHFAQLNPWSVPAGVLLLPVTVMALLGGVMKILLTLCWPSAAAFWASACGAPIVWMRESVDGLNRLPGSSLRMPPPSIGVLLTYYGLLLLAVIPWKRLPRRWLVPLAPVAACAMLFIAPASHPLSAGPAAHRRIQVSLLSLGAGQTAVVQINDNHAVLIDAGSSTVADVMRHLLTPFLRQQNCRRIDRIFLSHGDFDHIGAAADIFGAYDQPMIFMSPHFARHAVGNIPAEALLETLERADRRPTMIHQGDHVDLGDGSVIDVLWPPEDCDMNSNNCGLVLKLNFAGNTVLFPADIQDLAELALLKHPQLLKSDILIAPHHGSAEATTAAFIKAVAPRMILASNAIKLTHKQKVFDDLERDYPLYRTSRCGTITVTIDQDGTIGVETFTGAGALGATAH